MLKRINRKFIFAQTPRDGKDFYSDFTTLSTSLTIVIAKLSTVKKV